MKIIIQHTILNNDIKNRISLNKPLSLKLSIIIVNFNVKYFLEQCLYSVIKASENIDTEVIVVDNNSTDGSKEFYRNRFANVQFLWNEENVGFSKANNQALKRAVGKFILFLNPDTILPEDCLEKCIAYFELQNEPGAMGIRMIDGSGNYLKESKRGFPSPITSFFKLSGLTALFPSSKIFARYYLGQLDQHQNHEVDVLAGAFMLVKKSVLDITGGFDERFFMYGEDIDLSYRIQKSGYKNYYFSETTILHFKGESTKRGSLNYVRVFYGAMSLFVKKHYSKGIARFYNLLIQPAIGIRAIFSGFGHWLSQLNNQKKEGARSNKCIIIADKNEFDFIKAILEKNNLQQNIAGRISPNRCLEEGAIGNLDSLPGLVINKKVEEVIFCINSFTAKETISMIQQLTAGINARFHFKGSVGIVESKLQASHSDS